jgi:polar amino acid transport system ATP-binding protein
MGMVFQAFNLFNHMNIIENVMAAPVDLLKKSRQEAYDKGMELLRTVGLADKAFNYPDELSGGQKQRVAIARALAMEPEIILLDEPTSALDPTMVGEVQAVIKELAKKGLTLMIVTHEMRFAREIANRVFYMDEGGVYEDGTPEEIFDNPKREKTIRFIKHLKVFETLITSKDFDFIGFNTSLEEFGRKNQVSAKSIYRAQVVFEELGVQIILPQLKDEFKLSIALEYSQDDEVLSMLIKYDGKCFDVRESDNTLSLRLAENASQSVEYFNIDEDGYTNLVAVTIK